jgi:preprotein translocase subunit YajC
MRQAQVRRKEHEMETVKNGDAVVVTGSGYGVVVRQKDGTTRVRFLTGTEEEVDSRYVELAAPSLAEQIKQQIKAQK